MSFKTFKFSHHTGYFESNLLPAGLSLEPTEYQCSVNKSGLVKYESKIDIHGLVSPKLTWKLNADEVQELNQLINKIPTIGSIEEMITDASSSNITVVLEDGQKLKYDYYGCFGDEHKIIFW